MNECQACTQINHGTSELSHTLFETDNIIGVVLSGHAASKGHCMILPKVHYKKMHQIPDQILQEIVVALKKLATILGVENYNILQNNGALSFQTLFHAHFHLIPKYSEEDGIRYLRDKGTFLDINQSEIIDLVKKNW